MKNVASKLFSVFLLFSTSLFSTIDHNNFVTNPKIILFDVDGVLIDVQKMRSAYEHYGLYNSARALFQGDFNNFYTKMLSEIPSPHKTESKDVVKELNGKELPAIQRDFVLGKLSAKECIEITEKWVEANKEKFANDIQRENFKKTIRFYFEPKTFFKFHAKTSCMDLMKKLFEIKVKDGKRKNIIIVVANQSKEHAAELKEIFPDIFKYSDEQLFSCNEGNLKSALFEKCLSFCPAKSYYYSFLIDSTVTEAKPLMLTKHCLEIIHPNKAEEELSSFGALSSEVNL